MKKPHVLISLVLATILCGCTAPQAYVEKSGRPSPQLSYVGGNFVSNSATFISALVLKNTRTQQEYVLPFANQAFTAVPHVETGILALPPGKYKIVKWLSYNATSKGTEMTRSIDKGMLAMDFDLSPGKIVFLGKLTGDTKWTPTAFTSHTESGVRPEKISDVTARKLLLESYPDFSNTAFACLLCMPANVQ